MSDKPVKPCKTPGCQRPIIPRRRLCWRCWNHKKKYGLTGEELAKKRQRGSCCFLCGKHKRYLDFTYGITKPVCKSCFMALRVVRAPGWLVKALPLLNGEEGDTA